MTEKGLMDILHDIQQELAAPKNLTNKFGGYQYRNKEGILAAVKPLLPDGCIIVVNDELVEIAGRFYIKATATIMLGTQQLWSWGWAREQEEKKGMDAAQITGAASSYAGKYALNNLLAIDDSSLDPDATNKHGKEDNVETEARSKVSKQDRLAWLDSQTDYNLARTAASSMMKEAKRDGWEVELTDHMKALKIKLEGK